MDCCAVDLGLHGLTSLVATAAFGACTRAGESVSDVVVTSFLAPAPSPSSSSTCTASQRASSCSLSTLLELT